MKKTDAIALFTTGTALAEAVGLTKQAISQWPEELDQARTDMVIGAAVRLGHLRPAQVAKYVRELEKKAA